MKCLQAWFRNLKTLRKMLKYGRYANLDMRFIGAADPNSTTDGFSTDKDIAIAIGPMVA
ncbi:hypothetical protein J4727_09510 [Providencia rettgeri]|uniref:Uncharacterized protein n=1 Tax=Providencia rettgeri TaxID=587 RepID=A0A939SRB8_PRORE|nr:hypothetical protein [Providencia rettgeri]